MTSILNNLVRFAALVSVTGFMTGLSSGHPYVQLIEFLMIPVWLHQDHKIIIEFYEKYIRKNT